MVCAIEKGGNAEQDAALHGKERNDDFGHQARIAVRGLLKNDNFARNALQALFGCGVLGAREFFGTGVGQGTMWGDAQGRGERGREALTTSTTSTRAPELASRALMFGSEVIVCVCVVV